MACRKASARPRFGSAAIRSKVVVVSRVAGIPELVEDGKTGLLFAPSDWGGLETSLRRLVADDGLRAQLADAAMRSVRADYDVERTASEMRNLFAGAKS